jgi:hypothetical protein
MSPGNTYMMAGQSQGSPLHDLGISGDGPPVCPPAPTRWARMYGNMHACSLTRAGRRPDDSSRPSGFARELDPGARGRRVGSPSSAASALLGCRHR